jgi:hypothetical protein
MANANRPKGLWPVAHLITGAYNGQGDLYQIAAADTNAYAIGDPVISSGNGDANGVPGITLAAATGAIRGVILGLGISTGNAIAFEAGLFNPNNLNQTIRPSGAQASDYYALVCDDPFTIFEVQEGNDASTQLTAANIGDNTNLYSGANNGFQSTWTIDATLAATTSTLQVRLLGLARRQDNAFGQYAKWLVKINNHELSAATAGV